MFLWLFIIYFYSLISAKTSLANNEFIIDNNISYTFDQSGSCQVNQKVKLTNKYSNIYPKEYQLIISNQNLRNLTATDSQGNIIKNIDIGPSSTSIHMEFNQPSINTTRSTNFEINYQLVNLSQNIGNIWKIDIPKHQDLADNATISLSVPINWGRPAYSSVPIQPSVQTASQQTFLLTPSFDQNISLGFGDMQLFDFHLDYIIANKQQTVQTLTIPIPPDTETQTIFFNQIQPVPNRIIIDPDGNYLAEYQLQPRESLSIVISGQAQVHPTDPNFPQIQPSSIHTQSSTHWPNHPTIDNLANQLKTTNKIYQFVVDNLNYDYDQIKNSTRKGPINSLAQPNSSICTDFSDLFVAISRSAGIPSREIQGFVVSQNPGITNQSQHLSGDLLHSWAQFWDQTKSSWRQVDPTWQKTTAGTDYYNSIDLNRLILVIHGQDSQYPNPPGSYKTNPDQKTVTVTPVNIPQFSSPISQLHFNFNNLQLVITNSNYQSLTNLNMTISPYAISYQHSQLPPFGQIKIDIPPINLLKTLVLNPASIDIIVDSQQSNFHQSIKNPFYRPLYINLVILSLTIIFIVFIIFSKSKWSKKS